MASDYSSLIGRLTRAPCAFDPGLGEDARRAYSDLPPELGELIAGAAGCSPYLAGLLRSEADWIREALVAPEAARAAVIGGISDFNAPKDAALAAHLRSAKRRLALLAALMDLGGAWSLEDVTGALSDLADVATDAALRAAVATEIDRGRLPGEHADGTGGMVAIAMGKMGAGELNYSSDIDLICLFDETRFSSDDVQEARASLVRATRRMVGLLQDVTADGYVFRTDLRLRPDAGVTPVCIPMAVAEHYYESLGRTWERAAYIKARASAGDIPAGAAFLDRLSPFVWRRHLDFAAIEDAQNMRLRIRDAKALYSDALENRNVKLGRGGIREIEFFTQTGQLIAGGRDPDLRVRGTLAGLDALSAAGWVDADAARSLGAHYRAHREVEHRLQMIGDAQTHALPRDAEGFERLAAFMGTDAEALRSDLLARFDEVHGLTEDFFAPETPGDADTVAPPPEITERWLTYPAFRSSRARGTFDRISPRILAELSRSANPEEALARFDGFLSGLPAGVQLFSLFEANPQLSTLIADICGTSPALADYLSRNSGVLDAVIGGDFFGPWPGRTSLTEGLEQVVAEAPDYEARLDRARAWMKDWHFRIGVHLLRGLISGQDAGRQYADLAGATLSALWPVVTDNISARHGPPPGRGAVVVGMGSLGAGWLTTTSDLDLIVIYDAAGVEASDGPRPLASRSYYARLTQALVTALSAPMAEGRLYEVDMRLRPSGKQGPVATALSAFRTYQREDAWTWEHLALTRARVIAGPEDLAADVEQERRDILSERADTEAIATDVIDMRRRLAEAKADISPIEPKSGPGRLMDIELLAATLALRSANPCRDPLDQIGEAAGTLLTPDAASELAQAVDLYRQVQVTGRLLTHQPLAPDVLGGGGELLMLSQTGTTSFAELSDRLRDIANRSDRTITRWLEGQE